jgi:hypothetical protein
MKHGFVGGLLMVVSIAAGCATNATAATQSPILSTMASSPGAGPARIVDGAPRSSRPDMLSLLSLLSAGRSLTPLTLRFHAPD